MFDNIKIRERERWLSWDHKLLTNGSLMMDWMMWLTLPQWPRLWFWFLEKAKSSELYDATRSEWMPSSMAMRIVWVFVDWLSFYALYFVWRYEPAGWKHDFVNHFWLLNTLFSKAWGMIFYGEHLPIATKIDSILSLLTAIGVVVLMGLMGRWLSFLLYMIYTIWTLITLIVSWVYWDNYRRRYGSPKMSKGETCKNNFERSRTVWRSGSTITRKRFLRKNKNNKYTYTNISQIIPFLENL